MIDEIGGPTTFNHYPWGWTWAGNTPFRRWKRETYRGGATDPFLVPLAERHREPWGGALTVRAHHRHGAHRARAAGDRPAGSDQGGPRSRPMHGVSFAYSFDEAGRADPSSDAVLRDVRAPGDRPRRLARGLPLARAHLSWRPAKPFGTPITCRDAERSRRQPLGALPRLGGSLGERQPRRHPRGRAHRDDRHVVRRGGKARRAPARRQCLGAPDGRASPDRRNSHELHLPARNANGAVRFGRHDS